VKGAGEKMVIREALFSDADDIARVHADSWREAYRGVVPEKTFAARFSLEPRRKMWRAFLSQPNAGRHFICELGEKAVGFFSLEPPRDSDMPPDALELTALYFDPSCWGKGFGPQAMRFIFRTAQARGSRMLYLWVLRENRRAVRFYERCGFRPDGGSRMLDLGKPIEECRFCRPVSIGEDSPAAC
jgi:RimJ/RimL family protein N-acetyltransferase